MRYDYNKAVNSEKLQAEIAAAGLPVSHINTVGNDVSVYTSVDLDIGQQDMLNSIVQSHVAVSLQDIIKKKVLKSIEYGLDIMAEFASENKIMGLTDAQMLETSIALQDVQRLLGSGSLGLAKELIMQIQPIPVVLEQARIDKYTNLIQQKIDLL